MTNIQDTLIISPTSTSLRTVEQLRRILAAQDFLKHEQIRCKESRAKFHPNHSKTFQGNLLPNSQHDETETIFVTNQDEHIERKSVCSTHDCQD